MLFPNFDQNRVTARDVAINLVIGGSGPPLLLLHGYPQTHAMWHRIAGRLAEEFTVVATDLRGYGDSDKPPGDESHATYSKRSMAADQVEVMAQLGFARFMVAGHDRGGRVAHRMALDHRDRVTRLAVLDIVPTHHIFSTVNKDVARGYYHWFFLTQPADFPERLIGADVEFYLSWMLARWGTGLEKFDKEAVAEYLRCFKDPATIHASCEDYRAAATIDLDHDEADMDQAVECPLLALWGTSGLMHRHYDVLECWRARARQVEGEPIECGHFLCEEAPEATYEALSSFFRA